MSLQDNSKTDKDPKVIMIFLCTTYLMKEKILNIICLVVESDNFTEKLKEMFKNTLGHSIFVVL